jgi:hypothetical protein
VKKQLNITFVDSSTEILQCVRKAETMVRAAPVCKFLIGYSVKIRIVYSVSILRALFLGWLSISFLSFSTVLRINTGLCFASVEVVYSNMPTHCDGWGVTLRGQSVIADMCTAGAGNDEQDLQRE